MPGATTDVEKRERPGALSPGGQLQLTSGLAYTSLRNPFTLTQYVKPAPRPAALADCRTPEQLEGRPTSLRPESIEG